MLKLHDLPSLVGKRNKRRGRGYGSNAGGHTVGFGQKGQKSRGRRKKSPVFDGQNTPQYRKMPKYRGFKSLQPKAIVVKSGMINSSYAAGEVVTPHTLLAKGLISKDSENIKVLYNQDLTVAVTFEGVAVSKRVADSAPAQAKKEPVKKSEKPKSKTVTKEKKASKK